MFANKRLWFLIGLLMIGIRNNSYYCSDVHKEGVLPNPASARGILSGHNVRLLDFRGTNIQDLLPEFERQRAASLLQEESTVGREERLGSLLGVASNAVIDEESRQALLSEAIHHYLNAADGGNTKVLFSIPYMLEHLIKTDDDNLLIIMGGKEKIEDAIIDLFKLAADCGNEEAEAAYRDRSSRRNPA